MRSSHADSAEQWCRSFLPDGNSHCTIVCSIPTPSPCFHLLDQFAGKKHLEPTNIDTSAFHLKVCKMPYLLFQETVWQGPC